MADNQPGRPRRHRRRWRAAPGRRRRPHVAGRGSPQGARRRPRCAGREAVPRPDHVERRVARAVVGHDDLPRPGEVLAGERASCSPVEATSRKGTTTVTAGPGSDTKRGTVRAVRTGSSSGGSGAADVVVIGSMRRGDLLEHWGAAGVLPTFGELLREGRPRRWPTAWRPCPAIWLELGHRHLRGRQALYYHPAQLRTGRPCSGRSAPTSSIPAATTGRSPAGPGAAAGGPAADGPGPGCGASRSSSGGCTTATSRWPATRRTCSTGCSRATATTRSPPATSTTGWRWTGTSTCRRAAGRRRGQGPHGRGAARERRLGPLRLHVRRVALRRPPVLALLRPEPPCHRPTPRGPPAHAARRLPPARRGGRRAHRGGGARCPCPGGGQPRHGPEDRRAPAPPRGADPPRHGGPSWPAWKLRSAISPGSAAHDPPGPPEGDARPRPPRRRRLALPPRHPEEAAITVSNNRCGGIRFNVAGRSPPAGSPPTRWATSPRSCGPSCWRCGSPPPRSPSSSGSSRPTRPSARPPRRPARPDRGLPVRPRAPWPGVRLAARGAAPPGRPSYPSCPARATTTSRPRLWAWGPGVPAGATLAPANVLDVAPTVLRLLGVGAAGRPRRPPPR